MLPQGALMLAAYITRASASLPLLPLLLLFVALFQMTWSFWPYFDIICLSLRITSSAVSSWSFKKRKGTEWGMPHPSAPLTCQVAHWWGTNGSSFLKILCLCVYMDGSGQDEAAAAAAWELQSAAVDLNWQTKDPSELKGALFIKLLLTYS